jgi:undecaprenyl-diphosphatase
MVAERARFAWRSALLFGAAAAATILFAAVAEDVVEGETDAVDQRMSLAVHRLASPGLDAVMRAISNLGSVLGIIVAVAITSAWAIHRDRKRLALVLAANAAFALALNAVLKQLFERPRPGLFSAIIVPKTWSFPSGHSMASVAVYGAIAAVVIELRPTLRWFVIPAAIVLIAAIGFSRVYLGVHWPFDVIAGFAAGTIPLAVTLYVLHRVERAP